MTQKKSLINKTGKGRASRAHPIFAGVFVGVDVRGLFNYYVQLTNYYFYLIKLFFRCKEDLGTQESRLCNGSVEKSKCCEHGTHRHNKKTNKKKAQNKMPKKSQTIHAMYMEIYFFCVLSRKFQKMDKIPYNAAVYINI